MEPYIVSSTPKGSALLAYGAARGPGWNFKLLALVAGSLALAAMITVAAWTLLARVTMPASRFAVIIVQPSAVEHKLEPSLRRDLPASWRAAIETDSRFPAILGATLGADHHLHAFALVARTARVAAEPAFTITKTGSFHLLAEQGVDEQRETVRIATLFHGAWSLRSNDAAFTLRADQLNAFIDHPSIANSTTTADEIRGTWTGHIGTLFVAPDHVSAPNPIAGPAFAILGNNPDDARPTVAGLLSQGIDLRGLDDLPQTIAIDPGAGGSIALFWPSSPSADVAGRLAAIQGTGLHKPLFLPDHSEVGEIQPGIAATSTKNGATILFLGDGLASTTLDYVSHQQKNAECTGITRFSLQGEALRNVLTSFSIPASWQSALNHLFVTESADSVHLCLE